MRKRFFAILAGVVILSALSSACSTQKNEAQAQMMPSVRIYCTSGDYNDRVPVTLNAAGTAISSYPAPTDLVPGCEPVVLADGWLLDRRGIGLHTVFTRYTYSQYRALPSPPSLSVLMDSVIPGSQVTRLVVLPDKFRYSSPADTVKINRLIADGLPGCKILK